MRYKNEYAEFISNRITELRMNKGVSEREMSLALGRSHSYINNITSGTVRLTVEDLMELCEYLGVSPSEFFQKEKQDPVLLNKISEDLARLDKSTLQRLYDVQKSFSTDEIQASLNGLYRFKNTD